jgi:restriction endonuclease S subunit
MSNLEWQLGQLREIAEPVRDKWLPFATEKDVPYIGLEHILPENPKIAEYGRSSDVISTKNIFKAGDTLFGKLRPYLKKVALADLSGVCSTDIIPIRANQKADSLFLYYLLSSPKIIAKAVESSAGNVMPRASWSDLAGIEIELPPLPEQKKIAEILSGIDTTIAQLKLKAQKLDALHFSLAEALFEVLHRDGEPSALQEFAEIRTGIAKNSSDEGDMAELPYMRVANVQDGYLDLSEIKTINVDKGRIARYLLQKGDVLINEGGDLDKVGRGVIWHGEIRECLHQNHVFAVRCSERLIPEFLSLLLKTSYSKNYFLGCAKQTTNLASINSTQLKSFPIPLPSLSAQKEFINHITSINKSISSVSKKISSLTAMKTAISSDLLSGRKRVTV